MAFDHEKLDVYQRYRVRRQGKRPSSAAPRTWHSDQLQRAALSIVLNIAEGAGKFSPADKAVFYTRARGSATESAAVLDVCRKLNLITPAVAEDNKALLERIAQMLTKLIKSRRPIE
jgi:four helix bundle protein